jgi:hypothetical protein
MIRNISGGPHIQVNNGTTSYPYISMNSNNPLQGMLRLNNSNIEVYDGSTWLMLQSAYTSVELNSSANAAINWAMQKMSEEQRIKELAKTHPAVEDAVGYLREAEDRLKVVVALTEKEQNNEVA